MNHFGFRVSDFGIKTLNFVFNPQSAIRNSKLKGFTLLEVMVAVVIMSTVLVTLIGLSNRSVEDVQLAEHMTTASMLARRLMVQTTLVKPRAPLEDEGEFTEEEFKDYTWKKTISPTPLVQVMEVRVAVLWKEGSRPEMVELLSYE